MTTVQRIALAYNSVYLVDAGDERVLVDTGPDYAGAAATIEAALGGRLPGLVVATHGHLDHAGLGTHWQGRGVPVAISPGDVRLATGPRLAAAEFAAFVGYAEASGAPAAVIASVVHQLEQRRAWAAQAAAGGAYPPAGRGGRWPTGLRYLPFTPKAALSGGERVMAGLEVVGAPGHTPGNVVVVLPAEGWLFSGDQLLPEVTPTPAVQFTLTDASGPTRFRSLPAFVASLRRLRAMTFTRCYPGHGEPFADVAAVMDANLGQIEQRSERVLAELRERGPATVYGIGDRLYPRAMRRRFWQIVATVQGHLDLLEDAGRVAVAAGRYEVVS